MSFGIDALRRLRERQQRAQQEPKGNRALIDVAPDAPYEKPEETIHVWNGERWLPWKKWLATTEVERADIPCDPVRAPPTDATRVTADCGGTRIWLVKDGERWLMHAGTSKPKGRRRDFATPFLAHAITTAEHWYGAASGGWRAEKDTNGNRAEAQDLYPEAEHDGKGRDRGDDELALDGR